MTGNVLCRVWCAGLCLIAASWLSGCVGHRGAFEPAMVDAERGVIYVYRTERGYSGDAVRIVIDQQAVGLVGPREHVWRVVDPGEHFVRCEGRSSMAIAVHVVEGESAFVRIDAGSVTRLSRPDPDVAGEQIRRTRPGTPAEAR